MAVDNERRCACTPPDPRGAITIDQLVSKLAATRAWAGNSSLRSLADRATDLRWQRVAHLPDAQIKAVNHNTVHNLFRRSNRSYLDHDLVFDLLAVMDVPAECLGWWREAWTVVFGDRDPAKIVTVDKRLPLELPDFVGRTREIDCVVDLISGAGPRRASGVLVIEGMAGVGKTQLAIRIAHELVRRGRFRGVQLYVDLRGSDVNGQVPVQSDALLDKLLHSLGYPGRLPGKRDARVRAYRNMVSDKGALILLDNVCSEEQIRDLLVDAPTSLTIMTIRDRLPVVPIGNRLTLNVLTQDESVTLLCRLGRFEISDENREVVCEIARQCGYLPQALAVIGRHIHLHPDWSLSDHVHALGDLIFEGGVDSALTVSYQGLTAEQQVILRLIAVSPCTEITPYAAAALIDADLSAAESGLHDLLDTHLIQLRAPNRYQLHDLVRAFAARKAKTAEPISKQRPALTRLISYYIYTASVAMNKYAAHESHRHPRINKPHTPTPSLVDLRSATEWLDQERSNLIATAMCASDMSRLTDTNHLSAILFRYLDTGAHYNEAEILHANACRVAEPVDEARARVSLGVVHLRLGRYGIAQQHLERALMLATQADDLSNQARAFGNLGDVFWRIGRYQEALRCQQRSLAIFDELGDTAGKGRMLNNLAVIHERMGNYNQAVDYCHRALDIANRIGNRGIESLAHSNLGVACEKMGKLDAALVHHQTDLTITCELGDRAGKGVTLNNIGNVYRRQKRYEDAIERHQESLAIAREVGSPQAEAVTRNDLAFTLFGIRHA